MSKLSDVILRDAAANRPAAGVAGRLFYDTTNGKLQRDNGAAWEDCEPGAAGADAGSVTYAPATAADWNGDADPGNVDDALDQLAARVDDLEGAGVHAAVTLGTDADALLGLTGQQLTLDSQNAHTVLAGPTTGAAADPTFRSLVDADVPNVMNAPGDIVYGGADGARTRLAKGIAKQSLTMNSDATAPEWTTPAWSVVAQTVVSAGGASSVVFSSIPSDFENLVLEGVARGSASATNVGLRVRFNDDANANYDTQLAESSGSSTGYWADQGVNEGYLGEIAAANAPANVPAIISARIAGYARTVFHKLISSRTCFMTAVDDGGSKSNVNFSRWRSTAAITKVVLFPSSGNFVEGSVFTLYGVR